MSKAHQLLRLALAAFLIAACFAQAPTGTVQGLISDPSGAGIPGAQVTIQNTATNEVKHITTETSGRFVQPYLLPATYRVTVEAKGFRTTRQDNIKLDVGQSRSVDFMLAIAGTDATVEVVSTTPPLDTEASMVGQVIENKRINDLPLNGRHVFELANMAPNVNPTGGSSGRFGVDGKTPGIGGSTSYRSEVQIDGVSNTAPNNSSYGAILYEPLVDSVQEFSVQTSTPSAEFGRTAGGVINVVTKSGTNSLHGSTYYFRRDSALDANDFFSNKFGQPKPAFERTQYGGSAGGPVYIPKVYNGKDKTFFFFGYEHTALPAGRLNVTTVPRPQWKQGDFSVAGAPNIYDFANSVPDPNNNGQYIRSPFPGNKIPSSRFDPVAVNVLKYYPDPNLGGEGATSNNYASNITMPTTSVRFDSRIDHNFSSKWRTFGRISRSHTQEAGYNLFGNDATPAGPTQVRGYNVGLDNTITLSPTLIMNVRYGASRMQVQQNDVPTFDPSKLGLPQSYAEAAGHSNLQFPYFEFDGAMGGQSFGASGWSHFNQQPYSHNVAGNITKILNRHTLKAGGEFRKLYLNMYQPGEPSGSFWMDQGWTQQNTAGYNGTGLAYGSFLLGGVGWNAMSHDPHTTMASAYAAFFVQDDFKASSKLTLNIGLRYDLETPRTDRYNGLEYFDREIKSPLAGKVNSPDCPACSDLRGADVFVTSPESKYGRSQVPNPIGKANIGPRFGIAYQLDRNTVVRSGYGLIYSTSTFTAAGAASDPGTDGFYALDTPSATWDNGKTMHLTVSNPFPDGYNFPQGAAGGLYTNLGSEIKSVMANPTRLPYSQQWNLNIQRELPGSLMVEIGYLGNRGLFLEGQRLNYNQIHPNYMSMGYQLLERVPNPFYGVITTPGSTWANSPTLQRYQLLAPHPQYSAVRSNSIADAYTSMYHGMSVRADKRFSQGFSLQVAFTAGKLMSDMSASPYAGGNTGPMDMFNRRLDWTINPEDISRRLVVGYVYELPFGRGQKLFSNAPRGINMLVSGWQANGIVTWQTGNPLVITGANQNTGIGTDTHRLNATGKPAGVENPTIDLWLNRDAFSMPANFTFGNLSPTLPNVRGPGLTNFDLSFFKNNYIGAEKRFNVQYRLEMFNALNHAQFSNPNTDFLSSTFGQISSTSHSPREIQMALKFIF